MIVVRAAASALLCAALSAHVTAAEITDKAKLFSLLCAEDKSTGFNWLGGEWVQATYKRKNYIFRKLSNGTGLCSNYWGQDKDIPLACYEIKEPGEQVIPTACRERWSELGELYEIDCSMGAFESVRASPDGTFVLTRTYSAFAGGEKRDSLVMSVGKCSVISD